MRRNIKTTYLFIALCGAIFVSCNQPSSDESSKTEPLTVFNQELAIPNFNIATINDSSIYKRASLDTTGIVLIKYFNPDCDHCQEEAQAFMAKKDSLTNIKTLWACGDWTPLNKVRAFAEDYKLNDLRPIVIGKELNNELLVHYGFSGVPFTAVYKDNQLIKEYVGDVDFSELIAINNGTYVAETNEVDLEQEE